MGPLNAPWGSIFQGYNYLSLNRCSEGKIAGVACLLDQTAGADIEEDPSGPDCVALH